MTLSKYCKIYKNDADSIILFSTKTASAIQIEKSVMVQIENGMLSAEDRQLLTELGFLVPDHDQEKRELLNYINDLNAIDTKLSVIVAMNLDCNLSCTYCFEGSRKGKYYMSAETAGHVVDFIERNLSADRDDLNVTFYGGEPLLSLDLMCSMADRLKKIAEAKVIEYQFQFVSNGTLLTHATAEKLKMLGFKKVNITLDGPESVHNLSRPFKGGGGTFNNIVQNIKSVKESLDIVIGGNFTEANYREFPKLLDYLLEQGITVDDIANIKFEPVFSETSEYAPPEMTGACCTPNEPWVHEAGIFLREEIMKRGFKTQGIQPVVCAIDLINRHIIYYDASIYKCPGFFERINFSTGNVRTGVVDNGGMYDLDNWKNEECLDCKYLPLCFGGCRYMKFVRDGNIKGVDCRKPYYDACLEALVKQDLKYLV